MTVRAKQSQIPLVGRPILEAPSPCVLTALWPYLLGRVDVVYIKRAEIGEAAFNAAPSELKDKRQLPFPIARALVDSVPVLVPKVSHTGGRAKAVVAFLPAGFAFPMLPPPMREVTGLPAKLRALVLGNRIAAMFTSSHGASIPKYFDIACQRIENAQRQGRLIA